MKNELINKTVRALAGNKKTNYSTGILLAIIDGEYPYLIKFPDGDICEVSEIEESKEVFENVEKTIYQKAEDLIQTIDDYARNYEDYGLPIGNADRYLMTHMILKFLKENQNADLSMFEY